MRLKGPIPAKAWRGPARHSVQGGGSAAAKARAVRAVCTSATPLSWLNALPAHSPSPRFPSPALSFSLPLALPLTFSPHLPKALGPPGQSHGHFPRLAGCSIWLQLDLLIKVSTRVLTPWPRTWSPHCPSGSLPSCSLSGPWGSSLSLPLVTLVQPDTTQGPNPWAKDTYSCMTSRFLVLQDLHPHHAGRPSLAQVERPETCTLHGP